MTDDQAFTGYCPMCAKKHRIMILRYDEKGDFMSAWCNESQTHLTFKNYSKKDEPRQRSLF